MFEFGNFDNLMADFEQSQNCKIVGFHTGYSSTSLSGKGNDMYVTLHLDSRVKVEETNNFFTERGLEIVGIGKEVKENGMYLHFRKK